VAAAMPTSTSMPASMAVSTSMSALVSNFMSAVPTVAVPVIAAPATAVAPKTAGPEFRPVRGIAVDRLVWLSVSISWGDDAPTQARCHTEQRN
jgi:Na+/H+ antiporter NhaD/arsenite permease-like protein